MNFVIGVFLGYLSGTLTESYGHKIFGHPSEKQRELYFKNPNLFFAFLRPLFQHWVFHHIRTYQESFIKQFKSNNERVELDRYLDKNFDSDYSDLVRLERYNLTLKGVAGVLPFAIPFALGPVLILYFIGFEAFFGSLLFAFLPVWFSKYIHPLLHQPHEIAFAHPIVKRVAKSRLAYWAFKNHFIHHMHTNYNFNLVPGGDYILRCNKKLMPDEMSLLKVTSQDFLENRSLTSVEALKLSNIKMDYDLKLEVEKYIALKNPSYADRFRIQTIIAKSRIKGLTSLKFEAFKVGSETYGMSSSNREEIDISKWSKDKKFCVNSYSKTENNDILYRGAVFKVGDILLTNAQCDSDGIYSTLRDEDTSFAHAALYCLINYEGKKLPSVLGMTRSGVRAYPLKAALSSEMITYAEVYRAKGQVSHKQRCIINKFSLGLLSSTKSYDFNQDFSEFESATCTQVIFEIFKKAGLPIPDFKSKYHEDTLPNLKALGIKFPLSKSYFMPDDVSKSEKYSLVSLIDNDCYQMLVARALSRYKFQRIWRQKVLDLEKTDYQFAINYWIVTRAKSGNRLAAILLKLFSQFSCPKELPSGPPVFISLAPKGDKLMKLMTKKIHKEIKRIPTFWMSGDWDAVVNDTTIQAIMNVASNKWCQSFKEKELKQEFKISKKEPADIYKELSL